MTGTQLVLLALTSAVLFVIGVAVFAQGAQQRRQIEAIGRRRAQMPALRRARIRLDSLLRRTAPGRGLIEWLRPSGLEARALEVVGGAVLSVAFFLFYLPPRTTYLVSLSLLAVTLLGGRAFIRRRQQQRVEAFVGQLPDLARLLSNAVAAGQAMPSALRRASRELDEPARSTLALMTDELRLGQPLDLALERLGSAIPSRELLVLVSTLVIQQRAGGDAVKALRGMSVTLEERKDLRREITTVLSGVRAITVAVIGLAVGSLGLLNSINDQVIPQLVTTTIGNAVLIAGFGLIGAGVLAIRRIARVEI